MVHIMHTVKTSTPNWRPPPLVVGAIAISSVATIIPARLLGLYWLYWGYASFKALFYEDLGVSDGLASTLGLAFSVLYAVAMLFLAGRATRQFLQLKIDARQLALWFACYLFVFGAPHAIRAIALGW